jgi:large subunit ribosomal protein L34e
MVRPALRSRSFRRVKVRVPGGRQVTQYRKRRPAEAECASCKRPLHGLPRLRPLRLQALPASRRQVSRPYGGHLCSPCMRLQIKRNVLP